MSAPICCRPCQDVPVEQVPGPRGPAGANGTNGTNGKNSFTTTTSLFVMPVTSSSVNVNVVDSSWIGIGQVVFVSAAGYMEATPLTATSVSLTNLGYSGNLAPGIVVGSGQSVSPGGLQGPEGTPPTVLLNDLSPTTTKGDLMVDNGANSPNASVVRMAAGTNKNVIHADSGQPLGLRYSGIDLTGANTNLSGALPIGNGGTGQATRQAALNALMPTTPATGDLVRYDGTNWVRLARGTAGQALFTNAGGTDIAWGNVSGVLQTVDQSISTYGNTATTVPYDDTIPQNTEGGLLMTQAFTPISSTSRLRIEVFIPFALSGAGAGICALFTGASANAIAAEIYAFYAVNTYMTQMRLVHDFSPGSTSAITFTVRVGSDTASGRTFYWNGDSSSRVFGGVSKVWMRIMELSL